MLPCHPTLLHYESVEILHEFVGRTMLGFFCFNSSLTRFVLYYREINKELNDGRLYNSYFVAIYKLLRHSVYDSIRI